jgi:DNA mismatch repair ATPase MutS
MKYMKTIEDVHTYKMKNGISYVKGGIKVLEQLKFPDSIVKGCNNYADKRNDK